MKFQVCTLLVSLLLTIGAISPSEQQSNARVEPKSQRLTVRQSEKPESNSIQQDIDQNNEIDDHRLTVSEPYKSLLQTTARFALAQTKLPNHIDIDTAISLLGDAGYILSKPSNLTKAIQVFAGALAVFVMTGLFFPGVHRFIEATWRNPSHAFNLDKYLANGLSERSVITAINSKTDEALSRMGLHEDTCREQSLCYTGEILKCTFPQTAKTLTKFVNENFSKTSLKDNTYVRAFTAGFVDRNCTKFISAESRSDSLGGNCLSSFVSSIFSGKRNKRSTRL